MPPRRPRGQSAGSRLVRFWWRAFAVAAVVYIGYIGWQSGAWRTVEPFAAGQCKAVDSPPGPADIAMLPDGSGAIVSSQDRRLPGNRGHLYFYDLSTRPGRFTPLPVPQAMTFHPQGIALFRADDGRIFVQVINRRSESNSTVEIFTLDGDRTTGYSLHHRGSVSSTLFVHPAGIAAAGPESFYLTNDRGSGPRWMHMVENLLQLSRSTVIYQDGRGSRVVAGNISFANGIALSADGGNLLVGSTLWRSLLVYTRVPGTGALIRAGTLSLPGGVDKIHRDAQGALWLTVLPNAFATVMHMINPEKPAPSMALRVTTTGGGTTAVDEAYADPGGEISAASAAAQQNNRLLIGAAFGNSIIDCAIDPAKLKPAN